MPRLEVSELRKSWPPRWGIGRLLGRPPAPKRPALDGVSFEVGDGEVVGLVGENGAGKTTLMKCALGLVRADGGEIRVAGERVLAGSSAHRRRIGYVSPVERSFYLRLSCRENLLFFSRLFGGGEREIVDRVERALASVHLADRAGDRVESLSSGMRQRLALARAFLHDPGLVLLDEPTRSLDPVARGQIHELVLGRREGRGVLIASHDLGEIENLCDRIVVLSQGRVVAAGSVDSIRRQLGIRARYEIELDGDATGLPGASGDRRMVVEDRGGGELGAALAAVASAGRRVVRVDRVDHPLEEAIRRASSSEGGEPA